MKNYLKIYSFLFLLTTGLCTACSEDDKPGKGGDDPEELKPLVVPANPAVVNVTDITAILIWEGSSTEYEVAINDKELPTQSISYGLKNLSPNTPYSWKVRSREGERHSEWVNGPDFTTTQTIDETIGWPGEWKAGNFKLEISVQGVSIPVDMFIPEDLLNKKIGVTIEKKEGTNNRILFSSPELKDILPIPLTIDMAVDENKIAFLHILDDTIKAPIKEPIQISDLPFISEIPGVGELLKDAKITELGIIVQNMSVNGKLEEGHIPVNLSITGKFRLVTDNILANTALNLLPLSVNMNAGMTLTPKKE